MQTNPRRRYLPAPQVSNSIARLQPFRDESFSFLFDIYSVYEQEEFGGIIPFLIRQIKRLLKILALLSLSLISYHVFYLSAMPSFSVSVPIYFDYTGQPASSLSTNFETYKGKEKNTLPTPWASADLFATHNWDVIETEDIVPIPHTSQRLLVSNRAYFMELILALPESDTNRDLTGIFGVKVELASRNGTVLAVSRRSARFPHQSRWISTLQKLVLLVPLMVGAMEESKYILVPVFRNYVESSDHPLVSHRKNCCFSEISCLFTRSLCISLSYGGKRHVHVRIIPQQSAKALVEITKAEIRMGKEFNAFQSILRDWYFTCYTIGTLAFMMLYSLAWMIVETLLEDSRRKGNDESARGMDINNERGSGDVRSSESGSQHGAFRTSDQFAGSDYPSDQGSEWDDIFFDVPVVNGPGDSGRQSGVNG